MDSQQELPSFSLKILVDKEFPKVVVAEATKDFVDTLFSFLTLPLGTIIRLVGSNDLQHPASLVSINNLYQSVENLDPDNFLNDVCKNMLLNPRNPCQAVCSKLLMNVDNTEPPRYFGCSNYCSSMSSMPTLSSFANTRCICGGLMSEERIIVGSEEEINIQVEGGVFVKGGSKFLVFDDLKVMPSSFDDSLQQLIQLGYRDFSRLEVKSMNIRLQEILELLKNVLISHEPLTNTILEKDNKMVKQSKLAASKPDAISVGNEDSCKLNVKVICSKSKNKIMCLEVKEDFVDFIFGFLTIPLGSILKLLGGNSGAGCVDNLYNSVKSLDKRWCANSHSVLMDPGVAPQFSCPKQPLKVSMLEPVIYAISSDGKGLSIRTKSRYCPFYNLDPRAPNGKKEDVVGFVKRPGSYVVGDDLQVSPLKSTSMLSFVQEFNLPFDDIQVSVLSIGEAEALNLLRASLTSKSVLNTGLADFVKTPKQEPL